jgi:hypothetical protein
LGKPVHRIVIQSLLQDQLDFMKRVRGNGGARDKLRQEGIMLLSGIYDKERINSLGQSEMDRDQFIAVKSLNR